MNFFDHFKRLELENLPDPAKLTVDQKAALAMQLKNTGASAIEIAEFFGMTRQNVYKLLKRECDSLTQELENRTYLEHFVASLHELIARRDALLKKQASLESKKAVFKDDEEDFESRPARTREFTELGRLIQKYDDMILQLQIKVGLIPSNDANPYSTISEKNPETLQTDSTSDMTDTQLAEKLLQKLTGRQASVLKQVADEPIL